jgi:hypothetical protein
MVFKTTNPVSHAKYEGTLSNERNHILFSIHGVGGVKEEAQMRFLDIIPYDKDKVFGLWMGIDHDAKPISGVWLMSQEELNDEYAQKLIQSKTSIFKQLTLGINEST